MDATAFSAATLSNANDLALFRQIFSANDLVLGTGADDVFALVAAMMIMAKAAVRIGSMVARAMTLLLATTATPACPPTLF